MDFERLIVVTQDNKIYCKGFDFELHYSNDIVLITEYFNTNKLDIRQMALGKQHCMILTADRNIHSIGYNFYGETGNEICEEDRHVGNQEEGFSNEPVLVEALKDVVEICAGEKHSLALTSNGDLYAFGNNNFGQCTGFLNFIGHPKKINFSKERIISIWSGNNHCFMLDSKGDLYSWGEATEGKLGYPSCTISQNEPKLIPFFKGYNIGYVKLSRDQSIVITTNRENSIISKANK